jgi:hypothetical protein
MPNLQGNPAEYQASIHRHRSQTPKREQEKKRGIMLA